MKPDKIVIQRITSPNHPPRPRHRAPQGAPTHPPRTRQTAPQGALCFCRPTLSPPRSVTSFLHRLASMKKGSGSKVTQETIPTEVTPRQSEVRDNHHCILQLVSIGLQAGKLLFVCWREYCVCVCVCGVCGVCGV